MISLASVQFAPPPPCAAPAAAVFLDSAALDTNTTHAVIRTQLMLLTNARKVCTECTEQFQSKCLGQSRSHNVIAGPMSNVGQIPTVNPTEAACVGLN
jgi:hypothetical protein